MWNGQRDSPRERERVTAKDGREEIRREEGETVTKEK
jgi:hypothetical protein